MNTYLQKAVLAVAALGLASPALTQTRPGPTPPTDQVQTSDQVKQGSVQGAATTPLRDLNVMKVEIPDILLEAAKDPYKRPPRNWKCSTLISLVKPLDVALGPDLDQPDEEEAALTERGKQTALSVAGDLAGGAIPFRGVVRRISGAASHDRRVQAAILAGSVRRAYLKGLGEARGCAAPGSPSHALTLTTRSSTMTARDELRAMDQARRDAPKTSSEKPPAASPKSRP